MKKTTTKFRMTYENRLNPDNCGEGRVVGSEEEALAICRYHNWAYPGFVHRATEIETEQQ